MRYKELFGRKFNEPFEVSCPIPASEFKNNFNGDMRIYLLRNSDLVNQAVRYAAVLDISVILVGSLAEDADMLDASMRYWASKTEEVREGTNNHNMIIVPLFSHHELRFTKSARASRLLRKRGFRRPGVVGGILGLAGFLASYSYFTLL